MMGSFTDKKLPSFTQGLGFEPLTSGGSQGHYHCKFKQLKNVRYHTSQSSILHKGAGINEFEKDKYAQQIHYRATIYFFSMIYIYKNAPIHAL